MHVNEQAWLTDQFEEHRSHLQAVAYRMLGSASEAEDAVQESWLRLRRADTASVENLRGWLTTVVARVCLDMLRSRKSRREEPIEARTSEGTTSGDRADDPEHAAIMADSVELAMLVVLESLSPPERVAFVLHDVFDVPFDEIAPIVGKSPAAARQLASRARRRVKGARAEDAGEPDRRTGIVKAFLAASRGGDFRALLALLDPDVAVRADAAAVQAGAEAEVRGAAAVAETFSGRAQVAKLALIGGVPGAVWAAGGRVRVAFAFSFDDGKVAGIELIADAQRLEQLDIAIIEE